MPIASTELAIGSAVVAAIGAVAYFAVRSPSHPTSTATGGNITKRGKKKKNAELPTLIAANEQLPTPPRLTVQPLAGTTRNAEPTVPGGFTPLLSASEFEHSAASSSNLASKSKKKRRAKKNPAASADNDTPTSSIMLAPPIPSTSTSKRLHQKPKEQTEESFDESGWTRVKRKGTSAGPESDAGVTTSVTEEEGSVASRKEPSRAETLTLAEKLLPKPPKTAVDDMIDGPKPGIARVLRVGTPNYDKPAQGMTWSDYEDGAEVKGADADDDDIDNWDVVSHKRRQGTGESTPSITGTKQAEVTKKQRQNASKNEKKKAAKAEQDEIQRQNLARHKRQLEALRIEEQFKPSLKATTSGGMKAGVSETGSLIWE